MWKWQKVQKLLWKKSVIARVIEIELVNINMKTERIEIIEMLSFMVAFLLFTFEF